MPVTIPVTTPAGDTDAMVAGEHVHVPPLSELPRAIVLAGHTGTLPVIGPGSPLTVATTDSVLHAVT